MDRTAHTVFAALLEGDAQITLVISYRQGTTCSDVGLRIAIELHTSCAGNALSFVLLSPCIVYDNQTRYGLYVRRLLDSRLDQTSLRVL